MKNLFLLAFFVFLFATSDSSAEVRIDSAFSRPCLSVKGKPMLILGGELGNSTVTSPEDIRKNIEKVSGKNLNTILVPAYWDLIEPEEGKFDFSLTDSIVDVAKSNDLKVVFLWFGAWKNSMSCYVPSWVKRDTERFPRAATEQGKILEILSPFSHEVLKADSKAFTTFLKHLKNYDSDETVIMVQVENEIGMLESARDFSEIAQMEYEKGVPEELMIYLQEHKDSLHPFILNRWNENGKKMSGSWKDVFGEDIYSDEIFMAWNYAGYVEKLAAEGKKIVEKPFYLNAAMNSRGRKPGEYPSAGPLSHLKDIWMAGAPSIDFISPDIYDSGFDNWVNGYDFDGNVVFVPVVRKDFDNPAQAYYIIGHHGAIGISPFSIENGDIEYFDKLSSTYQTINELTPVLYGDRSLKWIDGVLLSNENTSIELLSDSVRITLSHYFTLPWDPRASYKENWNDAGGIIIKLAPEEYLLAGTGIVAKFEDLAETGKALKLGEDGFVSDGSEPEESVKTGRTPRIGLESVEEVEVRPDGSFRRLRSFNGDETHQGRHARISVDDNKILYIKTYRY